MAEREHFTNGRCLTFGTGFAFVGATFGAQVSGWTHFISMGIGYGFGSLLMLASGIAIAKSYLSADTGSAIQPSQKTAVIPGIPTLSSLLGQDPSVDFNARKYFALAYYSSITAEFEKNIKIAAQQNAPNDKEAFYARFIGVAIVAYQHDWTWFTIYGSQLAALEELNSRGLIPISDLRKHFDKAATGYPRTYEDYSFEQWLDYLKSRLLIATYPSLMVELSFNGKDFLKYLAHNGRKLDNRAN